jgi:hypothetical protein
LLTHPNPSYPTFLEIRGHQSSVRIASRSSKS